MRNYDLSESSHETDYESFLVIDRFCRVRDAVGDRTTSAWAGI
jgi:hypothetical protein